MRVGDMTFEADPGWVVVAPPDYGPSIAAGYVSIYDVVYDIMRRQGKLPDRQVTFAWDIYPLFARLVEMQWVNAGVLRDNGPGTPGDYLRPQFLAQLNDASPANAPFRKQMFDSFRNPAYIDGPGPRHSADVRRRGHHSGNDAEAFLAVTATQYQMLARWRDGNFVPGLPTPSPRQLAEVNVALQPSTLDRAALEACLGGAFHPGCEATWPVRIASMYAAPFRLKVRPAGTIERDYGDSLTPAVALAPDGPLSSNGPGALTAADGRAMAERYGELPLRLRAANRPVPAHVLGRARPQPHPDRRGLQDRHGSHPVACGAVGGVLQPPQLAA